MSHSTSSRGFKTNPDMDVSKRPFLPLTDGLIKSMTNLLWSKIEEDKNSNLKYCGVCHIIAEIRSGSDLHKSCKTVYTAKQIKGK